MSRTQDYIWTLFILLSCALGLNGQDSLGEIVQRDYEEEHLSYMLDNLSDRYSISIRYNQSLLPTEKYTYSFDDISMKNVLSILLNDKSLHYIEYQPDKIMIVPSEMVVIDSALYFEIASIDIKRTAIIPSEYFEGATDQDECGTFNRRNWPDRCCQCLLIDNATTDRPPWF